MADVSAGSAARSRCKEDVSHHETRAGEAHWAVLSASVEQENPLEWAGWQQVTCYRGETGAGAGVCVEKFGLRAPRGRREATAMLMRRSPVGQDVPSVTAASENLTHSLQNTGLTLICVAL